MEKQGEIRPDLTPRQPAGNVKQAQGSRREQIKALDTDLSKQAADRAASKLK